MDVYPEMEENAGEYFCHIIFSRQSRHFFYVRPSFSSSENSVTAYMFDKDARGNSGVFVLGSTLDTISANGNTGYLAYLVGWK